MNDFGLSSTHAGSNDQLLYANRRSQQPLVRAELVKCSVTRKRERIEMAVRRIEHAEAVERGLHLEVRTHLAIYA